VGASWRIADRDVETLVSFKATRVPADGGGPLYLSPIFAARTDLDPHRTKKGSPFPQNGVASHETKDRACVALPNRRKNDQPVLSPP
jgi:hypothetical protein